MNKALRAALAPPKEWDALPEVIRGSYTQHEWEWMSDADKAALLRRDTEPEWDEP